jgi:hypothetical protein
MFWKETSSDNKQDRRTMRGFSGSKEGARMNANILVGIMVGLIVWFLARYLARGIYTVNRAGDDPPLLAAQQSQRDVQVSASGVTY